MSVLTVFDWDDSFFYTSSFGKDGKVLIGKDREQYSNNIKKLIDKASAHGDVCIITNATSSWVKNCIEQYLHNCYHIIEKIPIYSTIDHGLFHLPFHERKVILFKKVLGDLDKTHIISVGDDVVDVLAAQELKKVLPKTYIKTIKMKADPTIEDLIKQHQALHSVFSEIVKKDGHLECVMSNEHPVGTINKL